MIKRVHEFVRGVPGWIRVPAAVVILGTMVHLGAPSAVVAPVANWFVETI